jgi:beta-barrel assembly-enhancing protease
MGISGRYFDGQSARSYDVDVSENGSLISFSGNDMPYTSWSIKGLHAIDPPVSGQPFRLTHEDRPGARLIVLDPSFIKALTARSSHLKGGYSTRDISHIFGWTIGGIFAVVALGYFVMNFLPDKVAHVLPDEWRNRVGKQMEQAMVENARVCHTTGGDAALSAMIARLAEGTPDLPPIAVHVYDMPILNAFAVSGGSIILTRELINKADTPDELAGVLSHEIGHVAHLHPEAQLARLTGMQVLASVFTGSSGGDMTTNLAFIATVLKFSRAAEEEADAYAQETMVKASIDPIGLKTFFAKLLKIQGSQKEDSSSALGQLGGLFSSHPGTEDRMKVIEPLPAGVVAKPSLTSEQWLALKDICKG